MKMIARIVMTELVPSLGGPDMFRVMYEIDHEELGPVSGFLFLDKLSDNMKNFGQITITIEDNK